MHPALAAVSGLAFLIISSCTPTDDPAAGSAAERAADPAAANAAAQEEGRVLTIDTTLAPFAKYVGDLPCDDCETVRTTLTLWTDPHRYLLTETFVGRADGDTTMSRLGEWLDMRSTPADPNARLVQLRFETAGDPRDFIMVGGSEDSPGSELRQLNNEQQPMPEPARWTLRLQ
ncbi:MAG TPA: copper resistance protein NlpE N-terminal domain-containing protein [Gemmatimonadales bacterium]|nr:copper resistance protein NlpE N-terminal domain-containing protein [Gemmatimonadales bacterium]